MNHGELFIREELSVLSGCKGVSSQMASQGRWKLVLMGVLPLLVFTLIEEYMGTLWGLIAGMSFGLGEILWEYYSYKKVEAMTWGGNVLLFVLGGVSLLTQEGVWFKLQPSILEGVFALLLWGSWAMKKPLLFSLMMKQNSQLRSGSPLFSDSMRRQLEKVLYGMTLRLGLFFVIHAVLAAWAAFYWSTQAWLILKGVGLTASLVVYMVVESLFLRYRMRQIS